MPGPVGRTMVNRPRAGIVWLDYYAEHTPGVQVLTTPRRSWAGRASATRPVASRAARLRRPNGTIRGDSCEVTWLTQLKPNRLVNSDGSASVPVSLAGVTAAGRVVHLQGYGRIKVFAIAARDGGIEYWATDDLEMGGADPTGTGRAGLGGGGVPPRCMKPYCGVERCQARGHTAQRRTNVGLAIQGTVSSGMASLLHRSQLGRSQGPGHPPGRAAVRRPASVHFARQCVTTSVFVNYEHLTSGTNIHPPGHWRRSSSAALEQDTSSKASSESAALSCFAQYALPRCLAPQSDHGESSHDRAGRTCKQ